MTLNRCGNCGSTDCHNNRISMFCLSCSYWEAEDGSNGVLNGFDGNRQGNHRTADTGIGSPREDTGGIFRKLAYKNKERISTPESGVETKDGLRDLV